MRIAALDVGDARIGVAVSDELGISCRGIGTVQRRGGRHDLEALRKLLALYEPERLVIGLPLNMDGSEGRQAARVRAFGARVAAHLALEVEYWDERLTTFEAETALRDAAVRPRRRRELVDQTAAAVILRSYLDRDS
jgi:putative Holliday junction resolvase